MDDINFTGIAAWFVGIVFLIVVLMVAGLLTLEMVWRFFAKRSKRKMLKIWNDKYGPKQ